MADRNHTAPIDAGAEGWDDRYRSSELVWTALPNQFLVSEVDGLQHGTAVDLACGEGRNAVWLAQQGWTVTGVDFSGVGLEKGRRLAAERAVEVRWIQADVLEWTSPPAGYDLVAVFYLQLPEPARSDALARAAGAVRSGGTLLVVAHDLDNLANGIGGPQDPAVLYRADDVAGVAEAAGLVVEKSDTVHRSVTTGTGTRDAIDTLVRARKAPSP